MNDDDKAAIESEIGDIRSNPENPLHQRFQHGDPQATEHVDNLYRRLHGVEPVPQEERRIEGELSAEEEEKLKAEIEQDQLQGEGQRSESEARETLKSIEWQLRQEWGGDYESNLQETAEHAVPAFGGKENFDAVIANLGLHRHPDIQVNILRELRTLARREKGSRR